MNLNEFGKRIKKIRQDRNETAHQASSKIGKERSYLSNVEGGKERPSLTYFQALIRHYSINNELAMELASLIDYEDALGMLEEYNSKTKKEVNENMDKDRSVDLADKPKTLNVTLNADKTPVLYTDSVFVSINKNNYGVVFNVAQQIDGKNQQIVARFGMSRIHAEKFAEVLAKHLALTISRKIKQ